MDIREIQALHAQYSSQPVVIDINSHVRALPAPERQESARECVTARLCSTSRKLGRPTAILLAVAAGAGLAGISAAKFWHALHPPQAVANIEQSHAQAAAIPSAPADTSTTSSSQRQLTSADFGEPADRAPATTQRVDAQAPRTVGSSASTSPAAAATPAAATDSERAAASRIRAERAASNQAASQQQAADAQAAPQTSPAPPSAPIATRLAVQPAEQSKSKPQRIHRPPAHPRQEASDSEAVLTHSAPAKPEHGPKPATSAKTGDVPLF